MPRAGRALLISVGVLPALLTAALPAAGAVHSLPVPASAPAAAGVAGAAAAATGCQHATTVYRGDPPAATVRFDPARIWQLSTGRGITVAVVATGIDANNAQFGADQVLPGFDALTGKPNARNDCDGRGTFVAGLIGARPDAGTAVIGLAPEARLLPVRVTQSMSSGEAAGGVKALAAGIDWARGHGAQVICVPVAGPDDSPGLRAAVRGALNAGVVVVAAGQPSDQGARTYPTAQAGVIGVSAVGAQDQPLDSTDRGPNVSVAAPGANVWSTGAGGAPRALAHLGTGDAGPLAAAYVCAVAALVRASHPGLTPAQVAHRIAVTAAPTAPPTGDTSAGSAAAGSTASRPVGVVDPFRAVAAVLPEESTGPSTAAGIRPGEQMPAPRPRAADAGTTQSWRDRATLVAVGGVSVALLAVLLVGVVRRGTARGWRPGRPAAPGATAPGATASAAAAPGARGPGAAAGG